ncbi:UNVERIFIED_CONTAM: hypothetical protein Slati_4198500 [Sesamum latifolium]|uniref:Uncharacterized protein n=1 Tax=Sesamum latifolium TaxID=2727402 RepID=A0AAW2TDI5_9LAMI
MDDIFNFVSYANEEALKYANSIVNLVMKEAFTLAANYLRFTKLRERFETFSYLISRPEVHYNRWDKLLKPLLNFGLTSSRCFPRKSI